MAQARSRKIKGVHGALIHALEKRLREGEKERTTQEGLGLLSIEHCPFCLHLGGRTLTPSVRAPCMYMQRQKKLASRQARKQWKEKHAKDKLGEDAK